jgi:signal transduction histidine kinase
MAARRTITARDAGRAGLVVLAMSAFVLGVYVVVVRGGGVLIGQTRSPHPGLSALATTLVALGFEPVLARARPWATNVAYGGRRPPDEVLRRFLTQVAGAYPTDDVPSRMAKLLAEGTGAAYAQVWLVVDGRLALAQAWPPEAARSDDPPDPTDESAIARGRRLVAVRHAGELLGALVVQEHERQPLTPVEERLFAGLAAQAGLVLRAARLLTELDRQLAEISQHAAELRSSRRRIVATEDAERRRLERDIHDGAQQHLVALAVKVRLAQTLLSRPVQRPEAVLAELYAVLADTVATLKDLSRGIYPRVLSEAGVVPALRVAAETCPVPVTLMAEPRGRAPADVEAALYFCCLEAMQNAAKHAQAKRILVEVRGRDGAVVLVVADDGVGFASAVPGTGAGLANMRDRVESVGGTLTVVSRPGVGTEITARIPLVQPPVAIAQAAASRSGPKADLAM